MSDKSLRDIYVTKFDDDSAKKFRAQMIARAEENPNQPIVIYIDSYGGYVDSLISMIETMNSIPNMKITVCIGKAMSCGAALLSHGDIRFCGKLSRVMIHEISSGEIGCVHDNYADATESKRLNKELMGLIARNCKMKGGYNAIRKIIKDQDGRNIWLNANDALKFGIVDHIGLPQVTPVVMFDVRVAPEKKQYNTQSEPKEKGHVKKKSARRKPTKKRSNSKS